MNSDNDPWTEYRHRGSLTAPQVARILGVSSQTVLRMGDSGVLPVLNLSRPDCERRTLRFPAPAIFALADVRHGDDDGAGEVTRNAS